MAGAGVVVLAGVVAPIVDSGGLGQILALVLISLGLVLATALVFYEVGLQRGSRAGTGGSGSGLLAPRPPAPRRSHLDRRRGSRRGPAVQDSARRPLYPNGSV